MPLQFIPNEQDFKDPNYHGNRRAFCDGCGVGVSYKPSEFVYPPSQVDDWIREHEEHAAPAKARKK